VVAAAGALAARPAPQAASAPAAATPAAATSPAITPTAPRRRHKDALVLPVGLGGLSGKSLTRGTLVSLFSSLSSQPLERAAP